MKPVAGSSETALAWTLPYPQVCAIWIEPLVPAVTAVVRHDDHAVRAEPVSNEWSR